MSFRLSNLITILSQYFIYIDVQLSCLDIATQIIENFAQP